VSEKSVTIKEWQTLEPTPGSPLAGLELEEQATKRIAEELTKSGTLEIRGLREGIFVRATSYVGSLKLGPLRLTIRPKLAPDTFLVLLRYAYSLRRLTLFLPVPHSWEDRTFQDLLILQLAAEAEELLSRGLHRRYEAMHDDLTSPRGKIDFQSLMRQGGLSQARLPCRHHPRLENTMVNRFLLAGLLRSVSLTEDLALRTRLRLLAGLMQDTVASIRLDGEAVRCVRRVEDRMTQAYRPARKIIELLLETKGITLDSMSTTTPAPGFLFDMNRFFQYLMSRFLRDNLEGLTVEDEYRLKGMMVYDPNPRQLKDPFLRPDYLIFDHRQLVAILDAKYRDLWEMRPTREMLYQLAIYALGQFAGVKSAAILYPTVNDEAREERILVKNLLTGDRRAQVILRPVNLLILEGLLSQPQSLRQAKQRRDFARYLIRNSDN